MKNFFIIKMTYAKKYFSSTAKCFTRIDIYVTATVKTSYFSTNFVCTRRIKKCYRKFLTNKFLHAIHIYF